MGWAGNEMKVAGETFQENGPRIMSVTRFSGGAANGSATAKSSANSGHRFAEFMAIRAI
jgi:hypothetical protein